MEINCSHGGRLALGVLVPGTGSASASGPFAAWLLPNVKYSVAELQSLTILLTTEPREPAVPVIAVLPAFTQLLLISLVTWNVDRSVPTPLLGSLKDNSTDA